MDMASLDAAIAAAQEREAEREAARLQDAGASFRLRLEEAFGKSIISFFGITFEPIILSLPIISAVFRLENKSYRLSRVQNGFWELKTGQVRIVFPVEWTCGEPEDAVRQATNADRLFLALANLRNPPVDDLLF